MKRALFILALSPLLLALKAGDHLPSFTIKNQAGKTIKSEDLAGKYVLLYFYPKDETPGCTREAQMLRDKAADFKKQNAVIYGVSTQDEKSHQAFIAKEKLNFDLLVDTDGKLAKSCGISSIPVVGLHKRQSLLIGPDGRVVKFYDDVDPAKHADEVLKDLQATKK